jgi:hypothetical protein
MHSSDMDLHNSAFNQSNNSGSQTTWKAADWTAWLEVQDLKDCANTIIGDETAGHKGVSGGQRRRIGIGLQLVRPCPSDARQLHLHLPFGSGLASAPSDP